jgi:arabinan endo-1,5-alpha-L-arabinosidase
MILPMRTLLLPAAAWGALLASPAGPELLKLEGDIQRVHDPAIARCKDVYYLFSTGGRPGAGVIPIRTSKDLKTWTSAGTVFDKLPEWALKEIPGARGAWAPDISFYNGKYHLYYSVSTFGSRNSAIGLATNPTLDPADPAYRWVDQGMVVRSHQERDDWNAIDPNIAIEPGGGVWLAWGSFWGGIKMRRVDPETGKLSPAGTVLHSLSRRPREDPINGSVEAPTLVRHGEYWYLFVSFDRCCRGAKSTYNVVAGRAKHVTGPYADRAGKPMTEGGGTKVVEATTGGWRGPGHQTVLREPGRDYLLFHAYDATSGIPHLHISTLVWEDGWPRAATLP